MIVPMYLLPYTDEGTSVELCGIHQNYDNTKRSAFPWLAQIHVTVSITFLSYVCLYIIIDRFMCIILRSFKKTKNKKRQNRHASYMAIEMKHDNIYLLCSSCSVLHKVQTAWGH